MSVSPRNTPPSHRPFGCVPPPVLLSAKNSSPGGRGARRSASPTSYPFAPCPFDTHVLPSNQWPLSHQKGRKDPLPHFSSASTPAPWYGYSDIPPSDTGNGKNPPTPPKGNCAPSPGAFSKKDRLPFFSLPAAPLHATDKDRKTLPSPSKTWHSAPFAFSTLVSPSFHLTFPPLQPMQMPG